MYSGNSSALVLPHRKLLECANFFHCVETVLYLLYPPHWPEPRTGLLALFSQSSDVNKDLATVAWIMGGFLRLQRYLFLVLWKLLESPHVIQLVAQCPVGWKSQYLLYLFILKYYMKSGNPSNWVLQHFI